MFSIPAVKGIEFGDGFLFAEKQGSCANDSFRVENGEVVTATNNNGGINGGISNGMPIIFRTVIKPTPSIFKNQETVDIEKMENVTLNLKGRHDPAIIHRAAIVQTSCTALCILDAFLQGMKGN
jgi:chorismate synthase